MLENWLRRYLLQLQRNQRNKIRKRPIIGKNINNSCKLGVLICYVCFRCIYVRSVVPLWSQSLRPQWMIIPVFDSWRYCFLYSADQTRTSAFQTYHQIFIFYCKWWSSNLEKLYIGRWLFTAYTSLEILSLSQSLRPRLIFVNYNQV